MNTITTSKHAPYLKHQQLIPVIHELKRSYKSHDHLFKRLIETFFAEFIEAFFPAVCEGIDLNSPKFLSEEIIPDLHDENESRLDIVAEVVEKSTKAPVIIHIEPQSYYQSDFNKRMCRYYSRLHFKFDKPVIPIAVFSYDESWNKNDYEVVAMNRQFLYMFYYTLHLRSLSWRDFIKVKNPVVAAFMSKMNDAEKEKIDVTIEFFRILTTLDITLEERDIVIDFFQSYVMLNEEEEEILMKSVKKHPDADKILEITNPFVEYGRRRGKEEGIEIGIDQGREKGKEEGIEQRNIEIASEMLAEGLSIDLIAKVTQLPLKRIEEIRQSKHN